MKKTFFLFFFVVVMSLEANNCKNILEEIRLEERSTLCSLFTSLIVQDHFAYTLFGDKPVSLAARFVVTPWENTIEGIQSSGAFWKKWEVWEQHKHLFPMKNFLIIKEPSKSKNYRIFNILIINKSEFIKIIKKTFIFI